MKIRTIFSLLAFIALVIIPVTASYCQTNNPDSQDKKPVIAFLAPTSNPGSDPEIKAAFDFLKGIEAFQSELITFEQIKKKKIDIESVDLVWFHKPDTSEFSVLQSDKKVIKILQDYLQDGGRMFLSLEAFRYIVAFGLETVQPQDSVKSCADEGYGRKLGFHAFRDHPLFRGLNGGACIWKPTVDLKTRITGYLGDKIPMNGKVIAVDWDYIFLRENSKLVLEYTYGKGKVIAAGAYLRFAEPNYNREHLELFTKNVFDYLLYGNVNSPEYYWDYSPVKVAECMDHIVTDQPLLKNPGSMPWKIDQDTLLDFHQPATGNSWDLAGERILTMGIEKAGIEEVWAHPFMAFRDYEVGIRFKDHPEMIELKCINPVIEVNPAYFKRIYSLQDATLTEVIVTDPEDPAGVIHYELEGSSDAELVIRFKSNLRLMWPYSEHVLNSICYSWDEDHQAFLIRDKSGDFVTMIGSTRMPFGRTAGQFASITYDSVTGAFGRQETSALQVSGLIKYALKNKDVIDIIYSATSEGIHAAKGRYALAASNPYRIYEKAQSRVRNLLDNSLVITTPDWNFNRGYRWSLIATDRFFVNTQGMGKALVAGYSTTRRGWDGGHKVNGRPGYGWYFGRDGQWSGMALLDYGDFGKVRKNLEFFNQYQDLSGKIFHEATTSGVIHYDAADATPLYLVLTGRYFRHSNDTAFIRQTWPNIRKAIDYCFSTDTDRDRLIENTNVGHGWVEGGELYGSHATLYLNSCWSAALSEASGMAQSLGLPEAESYKLESAAVRKIINSEFWNLKDTFYYYGKNIDGTFRKDPTILPAVTLDFNLADKDKAAFVLQQYASNAFTTDWGARIVRYDSPFFNPKGYHYGSVWPLFTGWTALAEYNYGNYPQGYSHIMNNLNIYCNWALGMVEEVMNGAEYTPSGVCPHQCWSESMILQPVIEGMLGLEVRAQENKVILAPRLPADWNDAEAANIRCGDQSFDFMYNRNKGKITYTFLPRNAKDLNIEFTPALPAGTVITGSLLNGKDLPIATFRNPQSAILISKLLLSDTLILQITFDDGIAVLPVVAKPTPGDKAAGLRLITASLKDNHYSIELEGKPETSGTVRVYCNQEIDRVENGKVVNSEGQISEIRVDFEKSDGTYSRKSVNVFIK